MNTIKKFHTVLNTLSSPILLVLDKCNCIHGDVLYTTKQNLQFLARSGTSDIEEIVAICSGYAYPLSFLPRTKHPTIIDLGGYIGEFCLYAYTFYNRSCNIHVYEPSNENVVYLTKNIFLNKADITIHNQGIYTKKIKGFLKKSSLPPDQFTISINKNNKTDQTCSLITFQDILSTIKYKKIDILKIDIEGTEHELINDPKTFDTICKYVKYLFIECHNLSTEKNTDTIMKQLLLSFSIVTKREQVFLLRNISL